MTTDSSSDNAQRATWLVAGAVLVGAATSLGLGLYGRTHTPTFESPFLLGFSSQIEMKAWLALVVSTLAIVQLVTALRMYGRIGRAPASRAVTTTHRVSGSLAVLVSLPVAWHCLWSLGFQTYSTRVLVHSLAGCLFYGAFVAKMLTLHIRGVPRWAIPVLGGLTFTLLVVLMLASLGWWFTNGRPTY